MSETPSSSQPWGRLSPAPTLLLRRVAGRQAAPALAMLALYGGLPHAAGLAATVGVYALVDVAAPHGAPVGAAVVTGCTAEGTVELAGLAVVPPYRRRGLGARILGEVVDVLRSQGAARVVAVVGDNAAARRLCERVGFEAIDGGATRLSLDL